MSAARFNISEFTILSVNPHPKNSAHHLSILDSGCKCRAAASRRHPVDKLLGFAGGRSRAPGVRDERYEERIAVKRLQVCICFHVLNRRRIEAVLDGLPKQGESCFAIATQSGPGAQNVG